MKKDTNKKLDYDAYWRVFNMNVKNYADINPRKTATRISLIYMIVGVLWVFTSDNILELISPSLNVYRFLQTIKGFIYIGTTTILLYSLIIKNINKIKSITTALFSNYEELNATYEELIATEESLRENYDELKLTKRLLEKSEERYQLAIEGSNDAIWDLDIVNNKIYFSPRWKDILGTSEVSAENPMEYLISLIHPEDRAEYIRQIDDYLLKKSESYKNIFRIRSINGEYKWIKDRGKAIWDGSGNLTRMVGSSVDITQEKEMEEKIYNLAYYDDLTGLTNKHYFQKEVELKLENDVSNQEFAIIYLGIDNFKKINNTMGYFYGDKILKAISIKLLEFKEKLEIISRFSGDEFVLLVSDFNNKNCPLNLAKSIIRSIDSLWNEGLIDYYINISLGVAIYPDHGKNYNALLTNANTAMHMVKEAGGNNFEVYNERIYLKKLEYLTIENDLRRAISNNEFIVYYQPKISFKSKEILGVEALIRWNHPEKGMIPPFDFIPVAEKNGLIKDIGNWVIRDVCDQVQKWSKSNYKKIKISINLSPMEFRQKNLVSNIKEIFAEKNIDTKYIEFEITESAIFENLDESIEIINSIKELGAEISLDDFGTGYSSLSYLRDLPIDILKLDKSFMRDLKNQKNKSIIKSMIDLSHDLGLEVVAEGVETKEDVQWLSELECDIGQGYYFYKPMPSSELEKLFG